MNFRITQANEGDLPSMQRLFYQTVTSFGTDMFTSEEINAYSRWMTKKSKWIELLEKDFIYILKVNGEIIGSFFLLRSGHLQYFFIHKSFWGRGLATALFSKLEEVAKDNNIKILTATYHEGTREYLSGRGFHLIENTKQVFGADPSAETVMVKQVH